MKRSARTLLMTAVATCAFSFATTESAAREIPSSLAWPVQLEPERLDCDQFSPVSHAPPGKAGALCAIVGQSFYQYFRESVGALVSGDPQRVFSTFASTYAPYTTIMHPDGTYTKGFLEAILKIPEVFGAEAFTFLSVENKYRYIPLNMTTVMVMGDPMMSYLDDTTGTVESLHTLQTTLYGWDNKAGAWVVKVEQFTYVQPVLGY